MEAASIQGRTNAILESARTIEAVLRGYPSSLARNDALRCVAGIEEDARMILGMCADEGCPHHGTDHYCSTPAPGEQGDSVHGALLSDIGPKTGKTLGAMGAMGGNGGEGKVQEYSGWEPGVQARYLDAGGWEGQVDQARRYLVPGDWYKVIGIQYDSYSPYLLLEGYEYWFNANMFQSDGKPLPVAGRTIPLGGFKVGEVHIIEGSKSGGKSRLAPPPARESWESIDTSLPPGTPIMFRGTGGWPGDAEKARASLVVEETYLVEFIRIGGWTSYVKLQGHDGEYNMVLFSPVPAKKAT